MSLSFGGVRAIRDVSFDIRKGEVRAIIGPNGAGKTSMLNVINGFYHPQAGCITFEKKGETPGEECGLYAMPRAAASRAFQNVALFKGMARALDNICGGPHAEDALRGFLLQTLRVGPALNKEIEHSPSRRGHHRLPRNRGDPQGAGGAGDCPYGLQKRVELGRALAMEPDLLLLIRRAEWRKSLNLEEKRTCRAVIVDVNDHYGATIALIEARLMGVVMDPVRRCRLWWLDHGVKINGGRRRTM